MWESLVRPVDDLPGDWRARITAEARRRLWPGPDDPARLGALVARVSAAYNGVGHVRGLPAADQLAARLSFFLPRDIPKVAGAARELVGLGLVPPDARVLDLGCGLGASTFGLAAGVGDGLRVVGVDADPGALDLFRALAGPLRVETRRVDLHRPALPDGPFDVVLLAQVISEVGDAVVDAALDRLAPEGALIVVEPALRERARGLHALRDRLAARGLPPFAPCLHARPCPLLRRPGDWCHEDLPVDLPDWLQPVARAAGLRWQGLTFAYLVVRRDGRTLAGHLGGATARVVDRPRPSRGKHELTLCGTRLDGTVVRRLDRHASPANAAWPTLARGEVLDDPGDEVGPETAVRRR